jgi:hypothetical protein
MAHDVSFHVPRRKLGRADVEFFVKREGSLLGTLKVSKGSIVWFPANMIYGHRMRWKKFHEVMMEHATRFEKR